MDAKFHPAIAAIKAGDLDQLKSLLNEDPTLATTRSTTSHPTLLQCLTLDAREVPNKVEMASVLIAAGAEINGPLVAAASIGNPEVANLLLDRGAAINGKGSWSPLEEALYWIERHQQRVCLCVPAQSHRGGQVVIAERSGHQCHSAWLSCCGYGFAQCRW